MTSPTPSPLADLVQAGWADHERDPEGVLARLRDALPRVEAAAQVAPVVTLAVHVAGEHLGRWADGLALLDALAGLPALSAGDGDADARAALGALLRSRAALHLAAGDRAAADRALAAVPPGDLPVASHRVRALAVAASALAGDRASPEERADAGALWAEALALAAYGPGRDDPAARALAVTGNNLACALEERADRGPAEDRLLEEAARAARRYWEVAGGWVEVERAEYRLARTLLALGRPQEALAHARACLTTCEANGAGPDELLFAHEVLTLAHRAAGDAPAAAEHRDRVAALALEVPPDLRELAASTLANLA